MKFMQRCTIRRLIMKFKKVIESGIIAGFALAITLSAAFGTNLSTKAANQKPETEFAEETKEENEVATIQKTENNLVAEAAEAIETAQESVETEGAAVTVQQTNVEAPVQMVNEEVSPWASKLMPNVEDYLNVRSEASDDSELVGKIHKGAVADIVERGDVWTKISSGSVEGYVKNEFCVTGIQAESLANEQGTTYATAVSGGVRVRAQASSEDGIEILDVMEEGGKLKVDKEAPQVEGWVAVKCNDKTGYISQEFVNVDLELGKAISVEEEKAAIAAAEAEKAKKAQEEQKKAAKTQKDAVAASYDDVTLLGALIQCEAGSEGYEGQLAVGAVVMNRYRAGYAGSISGVIYQRGQFSPASSGRLESVLSRGVSGSCLQAAQEAINGADNVGGAKNFKNAASGQAGIVIGNHVFF